VNSTTINIGMQVFLFYANFDSLQDIECDNHVFI
jgi:hypothetical protein